jgi:hypothetical protein
MWAQWLNTLVGIWLSSAPSILGYGNPARNNDYIVGPTAASFAIIAMCESTRSVRWVNALIGLWLLAAPWVLGYRSVPLWNDSIAGFLLILFSLVRGRRRYQLGGGWSALWKPRVQTEPEA